MKTILILDDEPAVRKSFADFFEDALWESIQAESAEEALKLLENRVPDAAMVDIRLPGMDGNSFIREVYQQNFSMAIVICTGSPEYVVPDDFLKLPYVSNHVFKKPATDLAEMEKEILRIIELMKRKEDEG